MGRLRPNVLWLGILAFLAGCSTDTPRLAEAAEAAGMNVLVVTVDTLRADHLGCYGHPDAQTPTIDALARDGLRFERATTVSPITLPSHASMFTGLGAPNHGVRHNGTFRLADEHTTLAERYAAAGYDTAAFVSAFVLERRFGLDQGFDDYDDRFDAHDPGAGSYPERPADRVTDRVLEWLDARAGAAQDRPFFVWVHYFDPHGPYEPPAPFDTRFADSPYDGEIAFVDRELGRLIEALDPPGTLVVLTSDHGEGLGEHGEATHADLIYDSTMRVPLIVSNPVLFPGGKVVDDRLGATIDLVPTLVSLSGLETGPAVDGVDLTGPTDPDRAVYVETLAPLLDYGWASLHGLRRYGDKFIRAPQPEYYDLDTDPGEQVNLLVEHPGAGGLRVALASTMSTWPEDFAATGVRELSPEEAERLAALGYVAGARGSTPDSRDPKDMMPLWHRMNEAGRMSVAGDHVGAITTIREVLRQDPDNGKAWVAAMQAYDRAGRPEDAETCARRALELRPSSDLWVSLARYALNRGDMATVSGALTEAERLDPDSGRVHLGHGYAEAMQGRYERAREEFETALRLDPMRCGEDAREQIRKIDVLLDKR